MFSASIHDRHHVLSSDFPFSRCGYLVINNFFLKSFLKIFTFSKKKKKKIIGRQLVFIVIPLIFGPTATNVDDFQENIEMVY